MKKIVKGVFGLVVGLAAGGAFGGSSVRMLEYLTCTGKQYIDTGVCPGKTTRAVMKLRTTDTGTDKMTFGVRQAGYGFLCWLGTNPGTTVTPCIGTSSNLANKNSGFRSGDVWTLDFSLDGVVATGTVDGEEVVTTAFAGTALASYSTDAVSSKTLMLFGLSNNGSIDTRKYVGDCYSFQLYDGGKLVRDLVPCISEDVVCMYNKAYNPVDPSTGTEYYMNQGSEAFVGGPALAGDDMLLVTGDPSAYPVAVSPAYGMMAGLEPGARQEVFAPAEQLLAEGAKVVCLGWKRYLWDDERSDYVFYDSGTENSFVYTHAGKMTKLEWQFELRYLVTLEGEGVTLDQASQWIASGSDLTVNATVDENYDWYGWHGDVDPESARDFAQTLTVDRPLALRALAVRKDIASDQTGKVVYVSDLGNDENDGSSWATAKLSVGPAAASLQDGEALIIGEGTFPISEPIALSAAATIRGVGMFKTVITSASNTQDTRGMTMNNADALIEDLAFSGFVRRTGGYDYYGLGLYINTAGGTARRCRFTNNSGRRLRAHGQGVYMLAGSLYGCLIDHNVTTSDGGGGGLYMNGKNAYVENCLIVGNVAGSYQGGGVWLQSGTMVNCTIAGNTCQSGQGGGVWVNTDKNNPSRMYNCIIWGNSSPGDANAHAPDVKINGDADAANYLFNCITKSGAGTEGLAVDPEFTDAANGDYTLRPNSPAVDAGSDATFACLGTVDFAGKPRRVGTIDIGCYEVDTSVLACGFTASQTEAFVGDSVTLAATVRGGQGDLTYDWAALEQDGVTVSGDGDEVTATFSKAGWFGFRLTVTDSEAAEPVSAVRDGYVYVVPRSVTVELGEDIQSAVDAAIDGQEIVLADGRHVIPLQISVDKAIRIVGSGYDACTVELDPANKNAGGDYNARYTRVFYVNHPEALVSGITITGGYLGTSRYLYGCGVWIGAAGGTVSNCFITGNSAKQYYEYGGGVGMTGDKALLTHCIVCSNRVGVSTSYGGGICMSAGTVDTCLVFDNSTSYCGGGLAFYNNIAFGKVLNVRNSTFTRNTAASYGGGIYFCGATTIANVKNCLFSGNIADNDSLLGTPEWAPEYNATAKTQAGYYKNVTNQMFSCAFYAANPIGTGSIAVDQPFKDPGSYDFHLLPGNGAVDAGSWYDGIADDLDGNPRDETPDIGCYELDKSQFTCSFAISPEVAFNDQPVGFTPTVQNPPENLTYTWTLTDRFGAETVLTEVAPTQVIAKCGWYGVKLRVEETGNPSNAAEFPVAEALHIAPHDLYAVGGGVNPTMAYPYDSVAKGHTNLVELAEEMIDGARVHLGEGEFVVMTEFAVTVGATVTGAGADRTVIRHVQPNADTGTRPLRINHPQAVVERLTLTGGVVKGGYNQWGTGVLVDTKGGTLRDCRVTGNRSGTYHTLGAVGVKSAAGHVSRCIIDNNSAKTGSSFGGGLTLGDGYVDNCLIVSNTASYGGGVYMSGSSHAELRNCTVVDNFTSDTGTSSIYPGGLYMPGVGSDVKVVNCIFFRNQPGAYATKSNCTGYPEFHANYNNANQALDSDYVRARLLNCLMDVDLGELGATSVGKDGIAGDPLFVDAAAWDFRLDRASPCVNAGDNRDYTAASLDLYGIPRVFNFGKRSGIVDIGCSESPWGTRGFLLMVR